jgi:hypothetical protein
MTVAPLTQPDLPIGRGLPPLKSQQPSGHRHRAVSCLPSFPADTNQIIGIPAGGKTRRSVYQFAKAISEALVSPNEMDRNSEHANVVDGLFAIARAIQRLASVIQEKG